MSSIIAFFDVEMPFRPTELLSFPYTFFFIFFLNVEKYTMFYSILTSNPESSPEFSSEIQLKQNFYVVNTTYHCSPTPPPPPPPPPPPKKKSTVSNFTLEKENVEKEKVENVWQRCTI